VRILVVQESDWITRGPHQQHQLFERLAVKGHEIRVIDYDIDWKGFGFSPRKTCLAPYKVVPSNIKVYRPWLVRFPILSYISNWFSNEEEIKRQIKEWKPDVIVAFGIMNADTALFYAHRNSIPFVYYWIDILHMLIPLKWMQWFGKYVEEKVVQLADKVVVINESMRKYILLKTDIMPEVIGAGVDLKLFKPSNLKIREQYGVSKEDTLLFFMGWVYSFSGLDIIARQLPNYPDFKLMVVGDGESFAQLRAIRDELNLGDRIILVDKRPYKEIPNYINAADICILPAVQDEPIMEYIVPIKIYEYMGLKKPTICTKLRGIVEEFGYKNGIVYIDKPEDLLQMASDIKPVCEKLGWQALNYVSERDWGIIVAKFEKLLEGLVK